MKEAVNLLMIAKRHSQDVGYPTVAGCIQAALDRCCCCCCWVAQLRSVAPICATTVTDDTDRRVSVRRLAPRPLSLPLYQCPPHRRSVQPSAADSALWRSCKLPLSSLLSPLSSPLLLLSLCDVAVPVCCALGSLTAAPALRVLHSVRTGSSRRCSSGET